MEWKKSNISSAELEKQQQAYIKEALEMAKRSVTMQTELAAAEKAAAEKAAAEKAAAEKAAAEKAAAEKAAAEKAAAEKAAAEKAAAERAAAEKSAAEKAAAEKAANENQNIIEKHNTDETESEIITEIKETDELTKFSAIESENEECDIDGEEPKDTPQEEETDIIDMTKSHKENFSRDSVPSSGTVSPPNFNNYINRHNQAQSGCPNCQRKRSGQ